MCTSYFSKTFSRMLGHAIYYTSKIEKYLSHVGSQSIKTMIWFLFFISCFKLSMLSLHSRKWKSALVILNVRTYVTVVLRNFTLYFDTISKSVGDKASLSTFMYVLHFIFFFDGCNKDHNKGRPQVNKKNLGPARYPTRKCDLHS